MAKKGRFFSREELIEAFWSYVDIKGPNDCWLWLGAISGGRKGDKPKHGSYGVFNIKKKPIKAHRFSLELVLGRKLKPWHEEQALHNCPGGDNSHCVNPAHLYLGTHKQNMRDMVQKGRSFKNKGEYHGMHKLTEDQVREIRRLWATGEYTKKALAELFDVTPGNIYLIYRGIAWPHVQ